ncbi:MAG: hypothetical protein HY304_05020 [candidate division Zixibacteria bacterium]|nr:hypothetical protein [candidate division Zixibacteria bacterium]
MTVSRSSGGNVKGYNLGAWLPAAIIAAVMTSGTAQAQGFGQLSTAHAMDRRTADVGGFFGVFENSKVVFGQYRRGLFEQGDGGIQFGIIDPDGGSAGIAIGADLKFTLMTTRQSDPFDLAIDARTAFFNLDQFTLLQFGGSVVVSRDYPLTGNRAITPYGAVNLRVDGASYDNHVERMGYMARAQATNGGTDTNFNIGAVGGVKWDASELLDIFGEAILDDQLGVILGVNFKI